MYLPRQITPLLKDSKKSLLLLGPRQTGKSTLIREELKPDLEINLAHEPTYLDFLKNPRELEERLAAHSNTTVYIDEVQRIPSLLNTIQTILDSGKKQRFILSGSSARKLKRGKANLLPGRIFTYELGPLCLSELDYRLDTKQALGTGTLPGIYTESAPEVRVKTLKSYAATYLKEEIQAESLARSLEGFSRFIFLAAQFAGKYMDVSKMAAQAQIHRLSAIRYFEILEDTLIIHRCESFSKNEKKRLVRHPKYYFFDTGVLNAVLGNFEASEDRKGFIFEHLFFNQLMSSAKSRDIEIRVSNYRTQHGAEVDFIVEIGKNIWAIELKASHHVTPSDAKGLKNFSEFYGKSAQRIIAYLGQVKKVVEDCHVLPWQEAIRSLGL